MIILTLTLQIIVYASFIWAASAFFKKTGKDKQEFGIRSISLLGLTNILLSLYLSYSNSVSSRVAPICFVLAGILFWWSVYTNRKEPLAFAYSELRPGPIVTSGPYKFVRHPFYVSYSVAWIGAALETQSAAVIIVSLSLMILYLRAALKEEKDLQRGPGGERYREYMTSTGRFFPKVLR